MKKRIVAILLTGVLTLSLLGGCAEPETKENASGENQEVTETPAPTEEPEVTPTEEPTAEPTAEPTEAPALTDDISETKVTLGQYKGLTLNEVDSETVAAELHAILEDFTELVPVDRAAAEGDTVNINFVGKKDGVAFEGGTDDSEAGTDLELGSGSFIDGFEDGLIGAVAGEVRDLNLTFPENYGNEELNGQAVVFTVTVNEVLEAVVPEATDAFAQEELGYDTWAEYVMDLYNAMNMDSFYSQITDSIMASSTVENYPASEIALEKQNCYDYYYNYAQMYVSYFGIDVETALQYFIGFESLAELEEFAAASAYDVVKNNLILAKIAEVENISISTEDYQTRLQEYANYYGYTSTEEFIEKYGQDSIDKAILSEYVMESIVSWSTIVEADYDAVIQPVE